MGEQIGFSDIEYANRRRTTRRESFLEMMDKVVPWKRFVEMVEPVYFKGERGRRPIGIETMLRMYFLSIWFNLSDEMVEDSIYDSYAMRKFMRINFLESQAPDSTTLVKFRKLLVDNDIQIKMQYEMKRMLDKQGFIMHGGSIVDATIIGAPKSTKNQEHKRDPEMASTKKNNQYYFGAKAHIGADAGTGLVLDVETTAANVADVTVAHLLIRQDDEVVYGDAGFTGLESRDEIKEDSVLSKIEYRINEKRSKIPKNYEGQMEAFAKFQEQRKSSVRCKVEYAFHVVKDIFGFRKTTYRGLEKLHAKLCALFMSANLYILGRAGKQPS